MRSTFLAMTLMVGTAYAADLNGDWKIEARLGETPIVVNCTLIQSGARLTGTCTPVMDNAETSELTGSVEVSMASWEYDVVFNGNPGHVGFAAAVESDLKMAGILDLSGMLVKFVAAKVGVE